MKKWLVAFAALLLFSGCEKSVELVHLSGPTMGTTYNIKYTQQAGIPDSSTLQTEIDRLLEEVNDQMSTYRESSELSQFNRYSGNEPFSVSEQTATVVKEAIRLNRLTQGALDVTVGPLVNLWGFGPEARRDVVPSEEALAQRKAKTGITHLSVDGNTLRKDIPDLYVDLSTIAKGWGVDVVADYIASQGIENYMVEIGGEIRLKGLNGDGVPWRIAVEKPDTEERAVQEVIEPGEMAIATSGDYRNYFERDGIRYSHIIDPKTGYPISNYVVSVTVLDKSSMTADGLATGLMVLGEEKGMAIAELNQIPVFMIVKTAEGFEEIASSAFKPYLNRQLNKRVKTMNTFLMTFTIFVAVIAAMAVGYIFQKKVVKGSCGGLGAVGIDKVCNCPEPCDARKKREAREAARAERMAAWEKDRIA